MGLAFRYQAEPCPAVSLVVQQFCLAMRVTSIFVKMCGDKERPKGKVLYW